MAPLCRLISIFGIIFSNDLHILSCLRNHDSLINLGYDIIINIQHSFPKDHTPLVRPDLVSTIYLNFQIYFKIYNINNIKYIRNDYSKLLMVSKIKGNIPLTIPSPILYFCRIIRFFTLVKTYYVLNDIYHLDFDTSPYTSPRGFDSIDIFY